jgi:hypothetical protein
VPGETLREGTSVQPFNRTMCQGYRPTRETTSKTNNTIGCIWGSKSAFLVIIQEQYKQQQHKQQQYGNISTPQEEGPKYDQSGEDSALQTARQGPESYVWAMR